MGVDEAPRNPCFFFCILHIFIANREKGLIRENRMLQFDASYAIFGVSNREYLRCVYEPRTIFTLTRP